MQNNSCKKPDLQDPDHQRIAHVIGSPVKHGTIVIGVEKWKVIKNTGVEADVNYQEGDQKQTRQRHHYFSTNCGCEELGPFHKESVGFEKFDAKVSPDWQKKEWEKIKDKCPNQT